MSAGSLPESRTDLERLAVGVSHELATPLNVVAMRCEVISQGPGPELVADSARVIQAQVDRMSAVLTQMLEFSRRKPPRKERADLTSVVRETIAKVSSRDSRGRAEIRFAGEPGPLFVDVDREQIGQALENLIANAIDAMQSGGTVRVRAAIGECAETGGEPRVARIDVEDQGAGIPPSVIGRIFDPFFSTKKNGEAFGLGLAFAERIVRGHGGSIAVESSPERGTCFSIFLPLTPGKVPPVENPSSAAGKPSGLRHGVEAGRSEET